MKNREIKREDVIQALKFAKSAEVRTPKTSSSFGIKRWPRNISKTGRSMTGIRNRIEGAKINPLPGGSLWQTKNISESLTRE